MVRFLFVAEAHCNLWLLLLLLFIFIITQCVVTYRKKNSNVTCQTPGMSFASCKCCQRCGENRSSGDYNCCCYFFPLSVYVLAGFNVPFC